MIKNLIARAHQGKREQLHMLTKLSRKQIAEAIKIARVEQTEAP